MFDDDTGAEPKIISASFADPFVLLLRDDSSIYVAQCDDDNELEEIEREDEALLTTKWLVGCLYNDTIGVFSGNSPEHTQTKSGVFMFLLSATGALHVSQHLCKLETFTYMSQIYALPNLSKAVFVAEGLTFVPPVLSAGYAARKSAARETITEIIVADLGDDVSKIPYLIVSLPLVSEPISRSLTDNV
jgi:cleavage and polyadenylation specificity factor subunit 1